MISPRDFRTKEEQERQRLLLAKLPPELQEVIKPGAARDAEQRAKDEALPVEPKTRGRSKLFKT